MQTFVRIRSNQARKIAAEYLKKHDPDMLEFLIAIKQEFGNADEIGLSGYEGLEGTLKKSCT